MGRLGGVEVALFAQEKAQAGQCRGVLRMALSEPVATVGDQPARGVDRLPVASDLIQPDDLVGEPATLAAAS